MSPRTLKRATIAACGLAAAAAAVARAQAPRPEVEPNDSKAQATPVTLGAGDWMTGTSTGAAGTGGLPSADYFLVQTAPLALGVYRHRLTHAATGHVASIRGLEQNAGVISTDEGALQETSAAVTHSLWYGFGRQEQLYYRFTGSASTTSAYTATLSTAPVTPAAIPSIPPGSTTITTVGQTGASQSDTDLWIYDAAFHPIPGFGNDDVSVSQLGSTLTRDLVAGTYYIAMSSSNLANDQASPPDDYYRSGSVFDFPGPVANWDESAPLDVSFRITDSASGSRTVSAVRSSPLEVVWFKLTVAAPATCYANCDNSTTFPVLNVIDFSCFLNRFAQGEAYANCDGSTTFPVLNVIDFSCFLNKFAAGCSAS